MENLNEPDNHGWTPLHQVTYKFISPGQEILEYLVAKGADVNAVDNELHSAVHWATGQSILYFLINMILFHKYNM